MISIGKELIEYMGITDSFPESVDNFKQFSIEENIVIPNEKPDIRQILRVSDKIEISNSKIIKTAEGISLDGQKLTGWKLIAEGYINGVIEYTSEEPFQSVQIIEYKQPFVTGIVLPETHNINIPNFVTGYIEDIYVEPINKREIYNNISVLLIVIMNN